MIIEGEKVIKKYYRVLSCYDNFIGYSDVFYSNDFSTLHECYNAYKNDYKVNRELHNSAIQEPLCYYRIQECLETKTSIFTSEYAIVHHRNGKVSLKRSDVF